MAPRSPTTRGGSGSPARVPSRPATPRWPGDPDDRPPTDAERSKARQRHRSLARFLGFLGLVGLAGFVAAPTPVLLALAQATPPLHRIAAQAGWWLQLAYPLARLGLLALGTYVLLHLVIGACLLAHQTAQRRRAALQTLVVDLPRTAVTELGRGVDLFAGLGELLNSAGRLQGREDVLVFGLVNGDDDHKVRLVVRTPARLVGRLQLAEVIGSLLGGVAPGVTVRPAPDDVAALLAGEVPFVGAADYVLARQPPYPLKDLAMFVGGDPLGPLATALARAEGVQYTAFEVILRALPPREDWRAPLRERIAQIQGTINPEDLAAHDALIRKVESYGFDVVIRCIVGADRRDAARRQLHQMQAALRTFNRPAGDAHQSVLPVGSRIPGRAPGCHIMPVTAVTASRALLPSLTRWELLGLVVGLSAGGGAGSALAAHLAELSRGLAFPIVVPVALPPLMPPASPGVFTALAPFAGGLGALAGGLGVLAATRRHRLARARDRLATLRAHAHHPVWPGSRWTLFPAPAQARSILGPYELAALWHPPSLELEQPFAWRSSKHLPAPTRAFLPPHEAQAAEVRQVLPRPPTPEALGACRLGLAYAYGRDGALALVGPTLRDLRQGWDTLGSMGSGKSSLVETMVVEIARLGGGCGVIDAKGDLCDRLLRILPPEAYDRVIVIDTTAPVIPCVNPFDRRIIGDKPRDVVAGAIGQIFARIEPEIWAGALGMQQALFMGISAILEGEREPTLLHLERFYLAPTYRAHVLSRVSDKAVRDYWLIQVPAMPEKIKTSIDSLKRRLTGLVGSETGQRLLCQPQSTIDLAAAMREQAILIIKFVPETIGETNAAFWGAALFQSIVSATFNQQAEADPERRWDWPLFVDEVQMFVKAERADDAERMWTRTRSMGVGLIGAHQGLNQLGEKLGGIVLNVIGGMCLTSGVRDDTHDLVNAYANQGLQPEDFTGVRPREELLIRFPVGGRDMGLMSAVPRERPPEQPAPAERSEPTLPALAPTDLDDARDLATLEDLERAVATGLAGGADLLPEAVYRAVANEWVVAMHQDLAAALVADGRASSPGQAADLAWAQLDALVRRLRRVSARRSALWAEALQRPPRTLPADEHLTRLSQHRYGVSPLINACAVALLVHRYPTDELTLAKQERGHKGASRPPAAPQVAPPTVPGPPAPRRRADYPA